ncbi:cryptochrome/photolyase family protein [Arenibacter certesii]|uniref:Deoxyribodipyrimidine photo-lyase n=1 Tax=Arenibacter certesii TaxID=228955 RepID=A0A918IUL4_9FLAO|nr:deoxyribodipyrimidine photo-lyase [Arenibacter certesii]GGW31814.1 deoxyribodipyrimidine photo-lyase [Arenibacter certesii]
MSEKITIFWFRRDLRFEDNIGLYAALEDAHPVLPLFIFDEEILDTLPTNDPRVTFIYNRVQQMRTQLTEEYSSTLAIYHGKPKEIFKQLIHEFKVHQVITNRDYEPYAIHRDKEIGSYLKSQNVAFNTYKDQVIFEENEIVKSDGNPYLVYTPYKNKWQAQFKDKENLLESSSEKYLKNLVRDHNLSHISLSDMGFTASNIEVPDYTLDPHLIQNYEETRDYPYIEEGTSKLGPHLRFGTISIRTVMKKAIAEENHVFWSELIWREFFMQILYHFPHTVTDTFKPNYDRIVWRNNEKEFDKWKKGETGYELVDAGMRELNATGFMHNRVRMLVASFLCKHLLIDWRWGEAYFAEKLLDYEMSSNIGNWQWAAGSGVDAAPYFRIFNPNTQADKFDKERKYINKWIPNIDESTYPDKMVNHKEARERCLKVYKEALR